MSTKSQYRLAKNHRVGIFLFLVLAVAIQTATFLLPKYWKSEVKIAAIPQSLTELQNQKDQNFQPQINLRALSKFNPNDYTDEDWKNVGLSERQIHTLNNYKNAINGFKSKSQFKKCYAISDELYAQIEPYILLPEMHKGGKNYESYAYSSSNKVKPKIHYSKFNPNNYTLNDWEKMGFTSKQAQTILNYKNKFLGGKFTKVEELEKCYAISPEKYLELKPFVVLPTAESKPREVVTKPETPQKSIEPFLKTFNINSLDEAGWIALGFTAKQVKTIMKYKHYCGGKFSSLEQFKKCYVVSDEMFEKLKPYIRFSD